MKILFFARLFYPHIGGVEKHLFEISTRLTAMGHEVTIVTESLLGEKQHEKKDGITIFRIPVGKKARQKKFIIWNWLWQHRELMKTADIIHCHDVFFWYLPFRFVFPRKKVFTTFHGYEGFPITRKAIFVRKVSEVLSRGNICIGDFIKRWYGTRPDFVSYGAVTLPKKQHEPRFKESAVFIGRLDNQTGIKTYIDAFKIIKKDKKNFELLVVGNGHENNYIPRNVQYKDFEKNAEQYLSEYRFAFVSRYLTILEAMAAKRLVFAVFDNPLKSDYLKMSPMAKCMVISDSPEEIAKAVAFYLTHPEYEKEHIENAYTWVKEQTWEIMVEMYIKLWRKS